MRSKDKEHENLKAKIWKKQESERRTAWISVCGRESTIIWRIPICVFLSTYYRERKRRDPESLAENGEQTDFFEGQKLSIFGDFEEIRFLTILEDRMTEYNFYIHTRYASYRKLAVPR